MTDDSNKTGQEAVRAVLNQAHSVVDLTEQKQIWRAEGDPRGYDVAAMNERYAMIMIGGRAYILEEGGANVPSEDRVKFISIDAFHAWHANELVELDDKQVSVSHLWMRDTRRRQYRGIVFEPVETMVPDGYYNLWQGFNVTPDPDRGRFDVFLDHVRTNLANGDDAIFNFIIGWAAHLVQKPAERIGTSLVFRGKMGAGKTIFGEVIGKLVENHYILADDPRYLLSNFNAHMASCLLLQADEGFWAGDVKAEGRLKGLVTSKTQMIEMKGKDPVKTKNYVHLLVTSNGEWVVPVGHDERRFAIFDVGDHCLQNHEYFGGLFKELENGGYEALLAYLLTYDLAQVNLRSIPRTAALLEHKFSSLSPHEAWWYECLQKGSITTTGDGTWPEMQQKAFVHASYISYCERGGMRSFKKDRESLGRAMVKLVPGLSVGRSRKASADGKAVPCFRFPPLEKCREDFATMLNSTIEWDKEFMDTS